MRKDNASIYCLCISELIKLLKSIQCIMYRKLCVVSWEYACSNLRGSISFEIIRKRQKEIHDNTICNQTFSIKWWSWFHACTLIKYKRLNRNIANYVTHQHLLNIQDSFNIWYLYNRVSPDNSQTPENIREH